MEQKLAGPRVAEAGKIWRAGKLAGPRLLRRGRLELEPRRGKASATLRRQEFGVSKAR